VIALLGAAPLLGQSRAPAAALPDVFPANTSTELFTLTADARRTYFLNSSGEVWVYDRTGKASTRVVAGGPWDVTVSPTRDALVYTRAGTKPTEQYVWLSPLDPRTGLSAGPERRVSQRPGDVPSISADGKWVAFARDDSSGVGQSIVVVPVAGGAERVVAPALPSSVDHIRWTPDGKTLYFGVSPPVACVPDWSCLPLPHDAENAVGTIRRVAVAGGPVTVLATGRSVWPGLSPDGTTIVYNDTGRVQRVVVADAANGRRLDTFVLPSTQTVSGWLSGATLLVRASGNVRRVRSLPLAGGDPHLVFESSDRVVEPAWSRDGKTMSVMHCAGTTPCELRILNAAASLQKAVPLTEFYAIGTSWSPDGRWITYTGALQNQPPRLTAMEVATGRTVSLADLRESGGATAVWLPDSRGVIVSEISGGSGPERRVAFRQIDLAGKSTVLRQSALGEAPSTGIAIDAATALVSRKASRDYRVVRLAGDTTERVILADIAGFSSAPVFSPDRQWIAFRRNPGGTNNTQMNVVEFLRTDGSAHTTIKLPFYAASGQNNPVILPGGKDLIVVEYLRQDTDPGVYLVNVATKAVKKLFTYPARPARYGPPDIAISPDGRTIVYGMWEMLTPSISTMDLSPLRQSARH
jgi:Tol biopolymer transport system component